MSRPGNGARSSHYQRVETVKNVELHQCAKFRQNRSNRGRHMWVSILCEFSLENAYSRHFLGFFGGAHFPQMMSLIVLTPKRTILGLNHVIWAINRECRSRGSSWALEREKGQDRTGKKVKNGYISPIIGCKSSSFPLTLAEATKVYVWLGFFIQRTTVFKFSTMNHSNAKTKG